MAWEVPDYPGYLDAKRAIFTGFIPGWERIFVEGDIDWRMVSWGGVLIDDRPYDTTDDPATASPPPTTRRSRPPAEATWLEDDDIVFGIVVNGEARAYPRRIMEVREMVNDTLGGRDLGIPYCTLCGAAQAYFTDELPDGVERPMLRTSGLLIRSNKVMYDVNTYSIFDTFLGHAVTGPLAEIGLRLEQAGVITTDWGSWREAYPDTTVLVEDLALGRDFDFRNTRDANGPIFPVGDVDPRLPVHEDVIGVVTARARRWRSSGRLRWPRFWRATRSWSKTCDLSSTPVVLGRWTPMEQTSAVIRPSGSHGHSFTPTPFSGSPERRIPERAAPLSCAGAPRASAQFPGNGTAGRWK
jgi:hypothetical protein